MRSRCDYDYESAMEDKSGSLQNKLVEPLLMATDLEKSDENERKRRLYAQNKPRIMLEVVSARTATIIIILTWLAFGFGLLIDLYFVVSGSNDDSFSLPTTACNETSSLENSGCSIANQWNSTVYHLENVISFELTVSQRNFSQVINSSYTDSTITLPGSFSVVLFACDNGDGCGNSFSTSETSYYSSNWNYVLSQSEQPLFDSNPYNVEKLLANGLENVTLVSNIFQNQESIPTNGVVKSYFVSVTYYDNTYDIFLPTNPAVAKSISYNIDILNRPSLSLDTTFPTIILLVATIVALVGFVYVVNKHGNWLTEQYWIVAYLFFLVLFQNPFYCVIYYLSSPSTGAVYASYVCDNIGQSGFFVVWLFFGDAVRRKLTSPLFFYIPKVFFGLLIFTTYMVVITFQFPNLDPSGNIEQSPVQCVYNWKQSALNAFVAFSIMYLILLWVWTLSWFILLWLAGRILMKIPYMTTRYLQLSYRFFCLQASLVIVYYIVQYGVIAVKIANGANSAVPGVGALANDINTLFRLQTQLFGKVLFLTVYAIILAFLFLPADCMENSDGLSTKLQATYVITEEELRPTVKSRRIAIQKMNRMQQSLMEQIVAYKQEVFCADLALTLCNMSFEMYYDPPGMVTPSGFGHEAGSPKEADLEKHGFVLTDTKYDIDHDTFCCIARHKTSNKLLVMFRGTTSKKHWNDNINVTQRVMDFHNMSLPTLDAIDGLEVEAEKRNLLQTIASYSPFNAGLKKGDGFDEEEEEELQDPNDIESAESSDRVKERFSVGNLSADTAELASPISLRATIKESTSTIAVGVVGGVKMIANTTTNVVVGTTTTVVGGAATVVGGAAAAMASAASKTPVLQNIVMPRVHSGFWDAYEVVREFIHAVLRRELSTSPAHVYFTGHSLGGALATLASLDFSLNSLPRINNYLRHQRHKYIGSEGAPLSEDTTSPSAFRDEPLSGKAAHAATSPRPTTAAAPLNKLHRVRVTMYNYGSPRVGNGNFAQLFDRIVPDGFRVVVDGDIVTGIPSYRYKHVGTLVLIDDLGVGSIIIDPSFVERRLRLQNRSSVTVHSLLFYRSGLKGIIDSAAYMRQYADTIGDANGELDTIKLAIRARASIVAEKQANKGPLIDAKEVDENDEEDAKESMEAAMDPIPLRDKEDAEESQRHENEYSAHNQMFLEELTQQNVSLSQRVVDIITPRMLRRSEKGTASYAVASPLTNA